MKALLCRVRPLSALVIVVAFATMVPAAANAQCCLATVTLSPGQNIQTAVNTHSSGTKFILNAGVYLNQSVVPKDYDQFVAATRRTAILRGSVALSSWTFQSPYWITHVTGIVAPTTTPAGSCSFATACTLPQDLFFTSSTGLVSMKTRQLSLSSVHAGGWYLDYSTGTVYIGDNPTGYTIEISKTPFAIGGGNITSVVIQGLVIEKYAQPANNGAIEGIDYTGATTKPSYNWTVNDNEVRYNHGAGIWTGNKMFVENNYVHHNGEYGIGGGGNSIVIYNNEIAYNNRANYLYAYGGGLKLIQTLNSQIRYNYSHNNNGPGLWSDIDNQYILYEYNKSVSDVVGIMHEIGWDAIIRYNTIQNQRDPRGSGAWWGAAILIPNSTNVQVYNNTISNCQSGIIGQNRNRGISPYLNRPYELFNLSVHNNSVSVPNLTTATAAGIAANYPTGTSPWTSWSNKYYSNTYTLPNQTSAWWWWTNNGAFTKSQWQAAGQDTAGTFQ